MTDGSSPADRPTASPDLLVAAVGDDLLVLDPTRERAHVLNRSAARIWSASDGSRTVADIVALLAGSAATDSVAIHDDVVATLDAMRAEGLVDRPDSAGRAAPPRRFPNVPHTDERAPAEHDRPLPSAWPATIGPYEGLGFRFDLAADDPRLAAYLADVLRPLHGGEEAGADDGPDGPDGTWHHYTVARDGATSSLALDGYVVARGMVDGFVAETIVWHINQAVSSQASGVLQLHASAAVLGPSGARVLVAFPASMDSGKSTLVTALVRAGASYVTDETTAVEPGTRRVTPYPKSIALDPGSWPLFPDLTPTGSDHREHFSPRKWHLDPASVGTVERARPPLGLVVFPQYRSDAATTLDSLAPGPAASRLAEHAFNLPTLGQVGVDLLAEIVLSTPCWSLTYSDLDDAVAHVHDLASALGGSLRA